MSTSREPILRKARTTRPIYSLTPFTLLDYPDKTACIVWFAGCNMRCLYCYNPDIVLGKGKLDFETALDFLQSRKGLLDGVVLSGGECTIHKSILPFIKKIKAMGFALKIDTNGSKPDVLKQLITENLIDYVALDFKANAQHFQYITQSNLFLEFENSLEILMNSKLKFEIRTTLHSDLIDEKTLRNMISYLENKGFEGNYYIQHFVNDVATLSPLNYSNKEVKNSDFSTSKIRVVFRT